MAQTAVTIGPVIRAANHYLAYSLFWHRAYYMLTVVGNCSNTNVHKQADTQPNSNPYNQKQSCRRCSACGKWRRRHRCVCWQPHSQWPATLCKKKCAWLLSSSNQAKNTDWGVRAHGAEDNTGTWQGDGDSCILRSFIICSSHVVRRVRKIAKSDYQFRHVCPSVRPMQQFGSHWADLHEIGCLSFFFESVKKIQCLIKIRQEERILDMRPIYIYDHISLKSSQNEKSFRQKL